MNSHNQTYHQNIQGLRVNDQIQAVLYQTYVPNNTTKPVATHLATITQETSTGFEIVIRKAEESVFIQPTYQNFDAASPMPYNISKSQLYTFHLVFFAPQFATEICVHYENGTLFETIHIYPHTTKEELYGEIIESLRDIDDDKAFLAMGQVGSGEEIAKEVVQTLHSAYVEHDAWNLPFEIAKHNADLKENILDENRNIQTDTYFYFDHEVLFVDRYREFQDQLYMDVGSTGTDDWTFGENPIDGHISSCFDIQSLMLIWENEPWKEDAELEALVKKIPSIQKPDWFDAELDAIDGLRNELAGNDSVEIQATMKFGTTDRDWNEYFRYWSEDTLNRNGYKGENEEEEKKWEEYSEKVENFLEKAADLLEEIVKEFSEEFVAACVADFAYYRSDEFLCEWFDGHSHFDLSGEIV